MEQQEFDTLLRDLSNSVLNILRQLENPDPEVIDTAIFRLESLSSHVIRLCGLDLINDEIAELITDTLNKLRTVEELHNNNHASVGLVYSGRPGRPRFEISREQLTYLLRYELSVRSIADVLCVAERTIFRRMREYGLSVGETFSAISNEELDDKVTAILETFPNAGYRRVASQLTSVHKVRVPQARVRETMQRVDPQGVAQRWLRLTPRRQYNVTGPLALWHIDGNHKLIRYVL